MPLRIAILAYVLIFNNLFLSAQTERCNFLPANVTSLPITSAVRNQPITIKVVFHIVYQSEEENIPNEVIFEQMQILNEDFNLTHAQTNDIPADALFNATSSGLHFVLADMDPDGNFTSGINRRATNVENIGDLQSEGGQDHIKNDQSGGITGWDSAKYINIWIGNRATSIGYTVPLSETPSPNEGIVINYRQIGKNDAPPYNYGRTLTHEMGHYLGLLHPWGSEIGCDDEDDNIDDTPFQSAPNYGCIASRNCNIQSRVGNFMDFHDDICLLYFTRGQCLKMKNTLLSLRPSLIEEGGVFEEFLPIEAEVVIIKNKVFGVDIYNSKVSPVENIMIFDLSGKIIKSINMKNRYFYNFPSEGIPSGIYLFLLQRSGHQEIRKIFIP